MLAKPFSKFSFLKLAFRNRKGNSKAIWIVATITAMMLVVLVYYASVSGFMTETVGLFNERASPGGGIVPEF